MHARCEQRTDSEIMAYASANDYIALTHDLDFNAILAATQGEKPGVVQSRTTCKWLSESA